jgi:hypothetical protein
MPELGCSFAAAMWWQTTFRVALPGRANETTLNPKLAGQRFADAVGVRRPAIYSQTADIAALPPDGPCVVKPTRGAGSSGVFVWFGDGTGMEAANGVRIPSPAALRDRMEALRRSAGGAVEWIAEELIREPNGLPARNYKFFAFYGRVEAVMEVRLDDSGRSFCWWSRDGRRILTGMHDRPDFDGTPPTEEQFALVERMSLEIPAPFDRIDFLCGEELVFGEFTHRPGPFASFAADWDRRMGHAFIAAQARLFADLRDGKRFDAFDAVAADLHG